MTKKFVYLFLFSAIIALLGYKFLSFNLQQFFIVWIFFISIFGTLFFWEFRVGFVFVGSGVLLLIHAANLEEFVKYASLDVIWFLIGMMIILAMLKEAGLFYYIITKLLTIKNITGYKLFLTLTFISWLLSGLMDEVTSIILICSVIFTLCDFLEISPIPFLISCIITTNIGSSSTVLGNPIGVLIALRGKLSFEDFIIRALPVSFVCFLTTFVILSIFYKKYIAELNKKLKPHIENSMFLHLISTPIDKKTVRSILIFITTVIFIALHRQLELLLSLEENTVLVMIPIIFAGFVLIVNNKKAREYIEKEIEWNSLLFFIFLFAQAGVLRSSGVAEKIASSIVSLSKNNFNVLSFGLLTSSGILSSILDNVVVVASYIPIVFGLKTTLGVIPQKLWWSILFGGCFGGNITAIGSTANIIALGLLEKKYKSKINFLEWLKVGAIVGIITIIISFLFLLIYE
jgi:Na+/H+ antiporter NhaD/arsenite permease-like protein